MKSVVNNKYDTYEYRCGKIKYSDEDSSLLEILMEFGESIDPQGYDGGENYDKAIKKIKLLYHK